MIAKSQLDRNARNQHDMGKVHRIKKDFQRLVSQPLEVGNHRLGGVATVYVGRTLRDKRFFLMHNSARHSYKPLIEKLIHDWETDP